MSRVFLLNSRGSEKLWHLAEHTESNLDELRQQAMRYRNEGRKSILIGRFYMGKPFNVFLTENDFYEVDIPIYGGG